MAGSASPSAGIVVPHPLSWHRRLAALLGAALLRLFVCSWRIRWQNSAAPSEPLGSVIYCVWHNRLLAGLASHNREARERWPDSGLAAMISASRDGTLITTIVERFGVHAIRGSTSRRGPQALLEATTCMERGFSVVITPDGPRGPVFCVQDGIILLAQVTGRPIIPVSNFTRWKLRLRSWDRFQVPLPFARCDAFYGEPIWVPREASETEREQLRVKLEQAMRAITPD